MGKIEVSWWAERRGLGLEVWTRMSQIRSGDDARRLIYPPHALLSEDTPKAMTMSLWSCAATSLLPAHVSRATSSDIFERYQRGEGAYLACAQLAPSGRRVWRERCIARHLFLVDCWN
jgi:hypothetical protein